MNKKLIFDLALFSIFVSTYVCVTCMCPYAGVLAFIGVFSLSYLMERRTRKKNKYTVYRYDK